MTIQTIFQTYDGEIRDNIYRKVYEHKNFTNYVDGFFAQREHYRWGVLIQIKGKERILRRSFGKLENGSTVNHLSMIEEYYVST